MTGRRLLSIVVTPMTKIANAIQANARSASRHVERCVNALFQLFHQLRRETSNDSSNITLIDGVEMFALGARVVQQPGSLSVGSRHVNEELRRLHMSAQLSK